MFVESPDIDRADLRSSLRRVWGLSVSSLSYQPVGFGTHHYLARDEDGCSWFVNVDDLEEKTWIAAEADLAFDGLERSLRTALELRHAGLDFVHAPIEGSGGQVVDRLSDDDFAVSLSAYIEGRSNPFSAYASDDQRRRVLEMVGRMHAASPFVPPDLPRRDSFTIPSRTEFFVTLEELAVPWSGGPYAEPAREVVGENADAIRRSFDRYDALAEKVSTHAEQWVITHGEPHAANIIETPDGSLLLIDWDTAAVAPRERDLWHIRPEGDDDWSAYGRPVTEIDTDAIELYRLWWALSEIAGYAETFRSRHDDDANMRRAWSGFQDYCSLPDHLA
jgi:spectinomycin phosphotransferase